jgi:diguanylate cyclase (GGDEF)-like protein
MNIQLPENSGAGQNENRDRMTGLYNRRYTMRKLSDIVDGMDFNFSQDAVGVVLADILDLKSPADSYGHAPTDEVIQEVARVLLQQARPGEMACRYGGDEFLLVVPHTTLQQMQERAEKLRLAANEIYIYLDGEPREKIRLSVGAAIWPPKNMFNPRSTPLWGVEALMQAAELELQRCRLGYLGEEKA